MDVKLPDGTIVRNVPDGTSKLDLATKLKANGMNVPDEWLKPAATATPEPSTRSSNPNVANAQDQLGDVGAASDLFVTGLLNTPHRLWEDAKDLFSGGITKTPGPAKLKPSTVADLQPGAIPKAIGEGASILDSAVGEAYPTGQNVLHHAGRVLGDVGDIASVVAPVKAGLSALTDTAATAVPAAVTKYGLRTGADHPIARTVAGESARPAVTAHNQAIADPTLGTQAGVEPGTPLTRQALEDAQAGPNSVYQRAEAAIPTAPLSPKATQMVNAVGADDLVTHSPDVQTQVAAQKSRILTNPDGTPRSLTGPEVVNTSKTLRYNGFRNLAAEDPEQNALGRAQMQMSDALHQHMVDTIPANSDVTAEQLANARRALAQNYTIGELLKGNNVDLQALAKLHRDNPGLLTGPMKDLADFADLHPEVTSLPSKEERFNPSGVAKDVASIDLKSPVTYAQPVFGAAARRVLTGALKKPTTPVTGAAGEFAPIDRTPQPPPGLTAGPMGAAPAAAAHQGEIPLFDLLAHGVEQSPEESLTAGPMGAPKGEGVPFNRNATHEAGDLGTHEPTLMDLLEDLRDHPDVMSQGVPEDIMSRTPRPLVNRGGTDVGSVKAASPEAINRGTRNVVQVDPDGRSTPVLKDVSQIDAKAPKGHLLMDEDTGEILDRGGLSIGHAEGLRNRYRALYSRPSPTLMDLLEASGGGG